MKHDVSKCESDHIKQGYSREDAQKMCSKSQGSIGSEKRGRETEEKNQDDLEEEIE